MDERRHNMDGALFVDEDRQSRSGGRETRRARSDDDGKADDARRVTQGILDRMDLEATARIRDDDEERVVIDIEGPDAGRAIGKKGMTLEALQFLVNKIVNRDPDERRHIVLDSGDYRERHDNSLVSMAKREAKRAVTTGRAVTLEPMSARDRRVIHVSLAKFAGVSTRSEGEGTDRRLQIIPARGERGGDRGRGDSGGRSDERPRSRGSREDRPRGPNTSRGPSSDERSRERPANDRVPANERSRERLGNDRIPSNERSRERLGNDRTPSNERSRSTADDRGQSSRERPTADDRGQSNERSRSTVDDRGQSSRERPTADDWSRGRDEPVRSGRDDDRDY